MIALLADLQTKWLLDQTLVVLGTEFGRTPRMNDNDGRDHHNKAFTCLLTGAGVEGTCKATTARGRHGRPQSCTR